MWVIQLYILQALRSIYSIFKIYTAGHSLDPIQRLTSRALTHAIKVSMGLSVVRKSWCSFIWIDWRSGFAVFFFSPFSGWQGHYLGLGWRELHDNWTMHYRQSYVFSAHVLAFDYSSPFAVRQGVVVAAGSVVRLAFRSIRSFPY